MKNERMMLMSNKMFMRVEDVVEEMFYRLVKQLAEKENVTENLKAKNQMLWVQKMNNIRNRATNIVIEVIIYNI